MKPIVPLDITIFKSCFMLIHLFVFILSNLVGFARLLMRTVEISARLMCLCYSVLQVPLYYIVE